MTERTTEELTTLSLHLASRREALLESWHKAADADPEQTTVNFLTRAQFHDHIPQLLNAFERKLSARPGGNGAAAADRAKTEEDVKHGLQRWQQGYRLAELMHEWGHLHLCIFDELEIFANAHPAIERSTMAIAHRELAMLINEGVNESAGQYARMQQAEAAGQARDLQRSLDSITALTRDRAELIHQAVHDLRGNVQSMSTAAEVLRDANIAANEREQFANLVQQGVESVSTMLGELMSLARLEAGQEKRDITEFDASRTITELCTLAQPIALEKKLFLKTEGAYTLVVQGDANKVRRILQNLTFNALKYTESGGVTLNWGQENERWWVTVKDTGPGILAGPGAPITVGMQDATESAREAAAEATATTGEAPTVLPPPLKGSIPPRRKDQQSGEGIGLSIVKRLCELLDASLELSSSAENGTTFRVVFPSRYGSPANPGKP